MNNLLLKPSLTVVIPTLNAASTLPGTLAALGDAVPVLVADGGSTDDTVAVAQAAGARVLAALRGRGRQLAAGIAATESAWLLLLHADTHLSAGWHAEVAAFLAAGDGAAAYFRFALDSAAPQARRLERLVAWRCRCLALPYGDQGLLIARTLLDQVGGVRDMPMLEDVDLVRRLGRSRLRPLRTAAVTSARRWERDGWNRRSARNLACLALYLAGIPPAWIARLYA